MNKILNSVIITQFVFLLQEWNILNGVCNFNKNTYLYIT